MKERIKMKGKIFTILIALLFFFPSSVIGDMYFYDEGYKGAKWGMSRQELKEQYKEELLMYTTDESLTYYDTFEGIESIVIYNFKRNKLVNVVVNYRMSLFDRNLYLDEYNRIEMYLNKAYGKEGDCEEPTIAEACLINPESERIFENGLYMTIWKTDVSSARLIMNGITFHVSLFIECLCTDL